MELRFAKEGFDVRVESIDIDAKMVSISATTEAEYLLARRHLVGEGWIVKFDSKRIPSGLRRHFAKQNLDIFVEAFDLSARRITLSAPTTIEYSTAERYLVKEGWTVSFDRKRLRHQSIKSL